MRGRSFKLLSSEGTQQGDCCGPIFFSVTLQQLLRVCCPASPDGWARFYLDDGHLCGKTSFVQGMFDNLVLKSTEIGLQVNLSKCKRGSPTPSPTSALPYIPWDSGVKVLGVPIGSGSFTKGEYTKKLEKLQQGLQRLKHLGCSFSAFHILRSCLSACKVMFLLRTLPYDLAETLAEQAQSMILSSFNEVFDVILESTQRALTRLLVRQGGLGILDPRNVAVPAHVASFLSSSGGAAS